MPPSIAIATTNDGSSIHHTAGDSSTANNSLFTSHTTKSAGSPSRRRDTTNIVRNTAASGTIAATHVDRSYVSSATSGSHTTAIHAPHTTGHTSVQSCTPSLWMR